MEYRTFGRTGLQVSVAGIGAGGASRLGLSTGSSEEEAVAVLHRALELGVNYFDTAANYGTEEVVGRALEGRRDEVVISSKLSPRRDGVLLDRAGLRSGLEAALQKLRTEVVDVYHLHRPDSGDYDYCLAELVPELQALRDEGKLRFLAISGTTGADPTHEVLRRAVANDCFDVVMAGFNFFNQNARQQVFSTTIEKDIAVEVMGAARGPFSRPEQFAKEVEGLVELGAAIPEAERSDPLGFITASGAVASMAEASYRFAAYEPGVGTVLIGTGNPVHLEANVAAIARGPLPVAVRDEIVARFGHLAVSSSELGR
ncbi:MAG TPA: aldo/keto reductase [Acidimicrobiales bacterium]|nr:aldo/keto reductase [Acidimicrobiales bacterium]